MITRLFTKKTVKTEDSEWYWDVVETFEERNHPAITMHDRTYYDSNGFVRREIYDQTDGSVDVEKFKSDLLSDGYDLVRETGRD